MNNFPEKRRKYVEIRPEVEAEFIFETQPQCLSDGRKLTKYPKMSKYSGKLKHVCVSTYVAVWLCKYEFKFNASYKLCAQILLRKYDVLTQLVLNQSQQIFAFVSAFCFVKQGGNTFCCSAWSKWIVVIRKQTTLAGRSDGVKKKWVGMERASMKCS